MFSQKDSEKVKYISKPFYDSGVLEAKKQKNAK